jgi:2-iminobutanoate/2-iminopropanoate deaminase
MIVTTPHAPQPIGPYSQAVRAGNMLFCSGQVALHPASGEMMNSSIEEETEQVLANLTAVLQAGGANTDDVVKTTIFLTDLNNFVVVNGLYEKVFGASKPARSTVQVTALPKGARVEIECIAVIPDR